MTKTTVLIEQLDLSEATLPTEGRFIEGVVLIRAGMSANRRYYGEDVLQKAVAVFEGARAFDNHKRGERSVAELTGWYKNVRYENGMLKADRHFTNTDAGRNVFAVVEDIVSGRAPKTLAGLSINATGTGKTAKFDDGDALNVESITFAQSVDDVVQPAAGGTYALTASDGDALTRELLQAMTFEEWWGVARPEFVRRVTNELKNARETDAVKAAKAEADHNRAALSEAQTTIATLYAEREAALAETQEARRELAIEKALRAAKLPALYESDLRERLLAADESDWQRILTIEKQKAKRNGSERVEVTGASQQVQRVTERAQGAVLDMSRVESPEELALALQRFHGRPQQ